jgi:hypothetical protein
MAEPSILFSAPMIKAVLQGRKTETRRIARPRRKNSLLDLEPDGSEVWTDGYVLDPGNAEWLALDAPYKPGAVPWARENYRLARARDDFKPSLVQPGAKVWYEADLQRGPDGVILPERAGRLRPSIHMPRWASRARIGVTGVRLERLHDIDDAGAEAEGVVFETADPPFWYVPYVWDPKIGHGATAVEISEGARACYRKLWIWINGEPSWAKNPRVWVITFGLVE